MLGGLRGSQIPNESVDIGVDDGTKFAKFDFSSSSSWLVSCFKRRKKCRYWNSELYNWTFVTRSHDFLGFM
jgi:hypothetical protein